MPNNLRVFNTYSDYNTADLVKPSVSYVVSNDKVYYDDVPSPTFQGKWKATYQDSHVESAQCGSSSAITEGEINKTNLVSVEIGDCVTKVGSQAFRDCGSLRSINIPNSVTSIGGSAFSLCTSLTSITIPNSVTSISEYAFLACYSLPSIVIPDSVTSIGSYAFQHCSSLTSVTINATTPPTLTSTNAFDDTNNCPIYVPSASVEAYKSASFWSSRRIITRIFPIPNS